MRSRFRERLEGGYTAAHGDVHELEREEQPHERKGDEGEEGERPAEPEQGESGTVGVQWELRQRLALAD
jgi:hypothetical protein